MPVEVTSSSRKRRRKEERQKKKQKRGQAAAHTHIEEEINDGKNDTAALAAAMDDPLSKTTTTTTKKKSKQLRNDDDDDTTKRQKKKNRHTNTTTNVDKYSKFDSVTAAALRADDDEIAALEAKLGLDRSKKGKNGKSKLNKEYAKLEGYGDDFGDFLDDLDDLVDRVVDGDDEEGDYEGLEDGFSDDEVEEEMDVDEDGNELIPMKPGADDDELDDSSIDDNIEDDDDDDGGGVESDNESLSSSSSSSSDVMADNNDGEIDNTTNPNDNKNNNADDSDSDTSSSSSTSDSETAAISENDTYRPSSGEDIYGNQITNNDPSPPVAKYTPPHARLSSSSSSSPNLSILSKNINSQFNRLSDNNLEPVSKSIASLYHQSSSSSSDDQQQQYATNDVNHCLYSCLKKSLIRYDIIVDKLIPLYTAVIAAAAGKSDLVGYVLEQCVLEFIKDNRTKRREEEEEMEEVSKEGLNNLLIICYLYNYDVVYCGLIYDIIRYLCSDRNNNSSSSDDDDGGDDELSEHDVEALLLIVQHCGFRLRKDDPSSLKDIVMAVQEKAATAMATTTAKSDSSSRFQYMIDTMTSLKHNKKTIKDKDQEERIMRYKKFVRRMSGDNGGNCLRIGLDDIMNINTKGRWWKVGASWKGNIYRGDDDDDDEENDDETHDTNDDDTTTTKPSSSSSQQQQHPSSSLLTLATANQIHDSTRQSLFCIIMSSADVDDAFEKLVRYVKDDKSAERLVIRVVLDCCAKERNYNPYYSHLACRLCEFFEKRCKWSLRLAFWDVFKRWSEEEEDGDGDDGIDEERRSQRQREVVNMSKMLIHFVKKGTLTTRGVLKGMDDLKFDARSMPELGVLFMVAFCDGIFDWDGMESRQVGDVLFGAGLSKDSDVQRKAVKKRKGKKKHGKMEDGEGDDNDEALRESLGVFLKLHMEKSPKNVKGTRWSKNFKAAMKACDLNSLDMI